MYTFLSGGTGTPKVLQGFRKHIDDKKITVVCNTGDDYYWNSLYVSPDLDTLLYLFSGKLDTQKMWGRMDESFTALQELQKIEDHDLNTWFLIGDKDLSLHVARNHLMKRGDSLSDISVIIMNSWNIEARIYPMSNEKVTTLIHPKDGKKLHFQEYFVKHKTNVNIEKVEFSGCENAHITPYVYKELYAAKHIIVGPSNPVTSIGPILSINEIRETLLELSHKTTIISPISDGLAYSGPTVQLMKATGIEPSNIGLGAYYKGLASRFIIDEADKNDKSKLEDFGYEVIVLNTRLKSDEEKHQFSKNLLEVL